MGIYTDEELDDLVRENIKLTKQNNKLLRKLWRSQILGFWSRILFFAIIIGVPVILYQYFLVDYVGQVRTTIEEFQGNLNAIKELPENISLSSVIEAVNMDSD